MKCWEWWYLFSNIPTWSLIHQASGCPHSFCLWAEWLLNKLQLQAQERQPIQNSFQNHKKSFVMQNRSQRNCWPRADLRNPVGRATPRRAHIWQKHDLASVTNLCLFVHNFPSLSLRSPKYPSIPCKLRWLVTIGLSHPWYLPRTRRSVKPSSI